MLCPDPGQAPSITRHLKGVLNSHTGSNGAFPWIHPLSLQSWVEDRHVTEVLEVAPGENGRPALSDVFTAGPDGRAAPRTRPSFLTELQHAGFDPAWLDQTNGTWTDNTDSTDKADVSGRPGAPR